MSSAEYEKLRWKEAETVRNLLKKQNSLLGDSLENLDHLIYLQKSINLLSLQEICQVMVEKLPSIEGSVAHKYCGGGYGGYVLYLFPAEADRDRAGIFEAAHGVPTHGHSREVPEDLEDHAKGWTVKYTTELTEDTWFYLRGEEYSNQLDGFIQAVRDKRGAGRENDFRSAAVTDKSIAMILDDNAQGPEAANLPKPTQTPRKRGWFGRA